MFYLPVFVNQRRMHVLHMVDEDPYSQLAHSFVMCAEQNYEVIAFPSERAQIICDSGDNVDLRDMDFVLQHLEESPYEEKYPGLPCYRLDIRPGRGDKDVSKVEKMYLDGYIGNDFTSSDGYFKVVANSKLKDKEYIFEIRYEHTNNSHGVSEVEYYTAAIRVFAYKNEEKEVCTAALDFGSEASQVYFKGDQGNLNLREAFCDIAGYDSKADYWQGRYEEDGEQTTLYKSIYHIHTKPGKTFLGDLPMNNGERTFIQSLLPVDHVNFNNLILLPNLKLIELLNYQIQSQNVDFGQTGNTDLTPRVKDSLGSQELRVSILRQILCNFLAVTMNSKRQETKNKLCLRFTLLVPNVYYQGKVASVIDGLYEDFDTLCRKNPNIFKCYRGIEVQTISESDASYFGIDKDNETDQKGAYRLVIDAGKGTTDFSLIRQTGQVLSHYESVYRSGIPASGHVLTYAFYEALREYFKQIGKQEKFEEIICSAYTDGKHQTKHLLDFVAALEEQKINYGKFSEIEDNEARTIVENTQNWDNLIQYVEWLNGHRLSIPGVSAFVQKKVDSMIRLLDTSIIKYAKDHQITLLKVYLSGRAFRFKPFREALEQKLIESGLVNDKEQIEFNGTSAKVACLKGAVADSEYTVNRKSIMLSIPTMRETDVQMSKLKKQIRHLFGYDRTVSANVDFDFFYEGLKKGNVTNVDIDICGRVIHRGNDSSEDAYLYFVGNGYLLKFGRHNGLLPEDAQNYNCDLDTLNELMHESLFPFDVESMGYKPDKKTSRTSLTDPKKNAVEEQQDMKPLVEQGQKEEMLKRKSGINTKPIISNLDD